MLAAKTGGTILPMMWSASSYFAFNTWDRLIVPKPFATIHLFYGDPILIPKDIKISDSETYRQQLEDNLNSIYSEAWQLHGKESH